MKFIKKITSKLSSLKSIPKTHKSIFILSTFVFCLIILLIVTIISKYSVIEINVFTRQISFTLPSEINNEEEISLFHSGLWTNRLHVENFDQFELNINSIFSPKNETSIQNPVRIIPNSSISRIKFSTTNRQFSVQELYCFSASRITYNIEEKNILLIIQNSKKNPYQLLGLNETTTIELSDCTVLDGKDLDITPIFKSPVTVRLHPLSRSLILSGVNKKLSITLENVKDDALFILNQLALDINFNKRFYQNLKANEISTLDSIFVKREYPNKNLSYKSGGLGDLELDAKPNRFMIYELSKQDDLIKLSAQGKFSHLKIGRGELKREMVPYLVSFIKNHPTVSILIGFLGWLIPIIFPCIFKFKKREN